MIKHDSANYDIKQIACVFFSILIFIISCKSSDNNKLSSISVSQKTEVSATNGGKQKAQDNFILDNTSSQDNGPVYMLCEKMPEFPGGEEAFNGYMRNNINYPEAAVTDKKEGRVVVKFIINPNGEPVDVEIIRKQTPEMNDECIRAIKRMPKWKPGMLNGKQVSVSYNITVRFLLTKSDNLNGVYILPSNRK
jgi:TonB family protein